MLGNLIAGSIAILVGSVFMPIVADMVVGVQGNENIEGTPTETILSLVTLFFALSIASAGIALAVQGLRAAGFVA